MSTFDTFKFFVFSDDDGRGGLVGTVPVAARLAVAARLVERAIARLVQLMSFVFRDNDKCDIKDGRAGAGGLSLADGGGRDRGWCGKVGAIGTAAVERGKFTFGTTYVLCFQRG